MNPKAITTLMFELSQLRRIKHEGLRLAGIEDPISVAAHSLRAAQIGYFLAKMERVDPKTITTMLVFHDMGECRTGDLHKVAASYVKKDELQAVKDQLEPLSEKELLELWQQQEEASTPEGIVAQDADWLEAAFTAKEYIEKGYKRMENWIKNVENALRTTSAKQLIKELQTMHSTDWWRDLKKLG